MLPLDVTSQLSSSNWSSVLRAILELGYFAAGIAIAVAAFLGLEQLKITKEIARTNAKREALKFAAERCQYFAEYAVPALAKFDAEYKRLELKFLTNQPPPQWAVQNGEITNQNFDTKQLDAEVPRIMEFLVSYINTLEAFAMAFVAGVADDDLGFRATAMAFCGGVRLIMPAIFQMRRTGNGRFESTIKLFELWNIRLVANAVAPHMKALEGGLKQIADLTRAAQEKIKPLGTE
jgi:hypothetical protein